MKPAKAKRPAKSMASSFARHVDESGQISGWTLFRRSSVDKRLFMRVSPALGECRAAHARQLIVDRMTLRATVDHYDLKKLGVIH